MIGYKTFGTGPEHVLVMHDWFCDCTSYSPVLPYLDGKAFTYVFADLRGYGKSKTISGEFTVGEASRDVLQLCDSLKWDRFHVVGHSMSAMVAQYVAMKATDRVKSVICITPVPACGSPAPANMMSFLEDAARSNDSGARQVVGFMTGGRQGEGFVNFKVQKWRDCSTPEARVAYLHMFAETDFSDQVQGLQVPFFVVVGAHDAEGHSEAVMNKTFMQWYPHCTVEVLQNTGHYPMQETPVYLATVLEKFLGEQK